jgi:uncharacterized delta-60 repeat protein
MCPIERLEPRLFLAAGMLDPHYGAGGKLVAPILGNNDDVANAVAQQRDGRIVVAGDTYVQAYGKSPLPAVARLLPGGSLDPTFGDGGRVVLAPPTQGSSGRPHVSAVALQRDGKILIGVIVDSGGIYVCRLNSDGSLDRAFGAGGSDGDGWVSHIPTETYVDFTLAAVLLRRDGRFVVVSSDRISAGSVQTNLILLQYRPDGSPDPAFGDFGVRKVPLLWDSKVGGAALLPDGSLVAGGGATGVPFLMRFDAEGNRDMAFNPMASVLPPDFPLAHNVIQSVLVQADGRIVIAGGTTVARLLPSGQLDSSFGDGGRGFTSVDLAPNDIRTPRLHIQKNQRLIVTGLASAS